MGDIKAVEKECNEREKLVREILTTKKSEIRFSIWLEVETARNFIFQEVKKYKKTHRKEDEQEVICGITYEIVKELRKNRFKLPFLLK